MSKKIITQQKGDCVVYKIGRRIVCFRRGYKYSIGKPSSACVLTFETLSENIAHERCVEICERQILATMQYENPVAYHAHKVLNALA